MYCILLERFLTLQLYMCQFSCGSLAISTNLEALLVFGGHKQAPSFSHECGTAEMEESSWNSTIANIWKKNKDHWMITETNQIMKMIKCCSLERGDLSRYLIETNGKMECIYLNFIIKDHFHAIGMSAKIEKMRHISDTCNYFGHAEYK